MCFAATTGCLIMHGERLSVPREAAVGYQYDIAFASPPSELRELRRAHQPSSYLVFISTCGSVECLSVVCELLDYPSARCYPHLGCVMTISFRDRDTPWAGSGTLLGICSSLF